MLLKCNYCDPTVKRGEKQVKTIDTDLDDYIKDERGKYYHTDCYKLFLKIKKKKSDDEIIKIIKDRKEVQELEMKETISKDKFLKWIMNYYDSSLSGYFLKKLQAVRNGTYQGINEPIDYDTLLDIYIHMANYLNKNAIKRGVNSISNRMIYDLAIVVGNYGDYKRFRDKQRQNLIDTREIEENIERAKLIEKRKSQSVDMSKEKDFNIADIIDDLLL